MWKRLHPSIPGWTFRTRRPFLRIAHGKAYYAALREDLREKDRRPGESGNPLPRLTSVLRHRRIRYERLGSGWMEGFAEAVSGPEEEGRKALGQISESLTTFHEELTSREWIHLYFLALRFGFFRLGYDFRLKARQSALCAEQESRHAQTGISPLKGMAALAESGNWELFDRRLHDLGRRCPGEVSLLRLLGGILRGSGEIDGLAEGRDFDSVFSDFVRNKTVCFVGPAKSAKQDSEEIDGHERVVRCNTLRSAGPPPDPVKGGRCDITYLNRNRIAMLQGPGASEFSGDIRWAVSKDRKSLGGLRKSLRSFRSSEKPSVLTGDGGLRTRSTRDFTPVLFNGSLTAAPNALLDLIAHGCRSIKVFHTDLMLTVERAAGYDPGIQGASAHLEKFILSCAGPHDPVTSYFVLSSLFRAGRVEGDEGFTAAMNLGEAVYMGTLERLYGRYGI